MADFVDGAAEEDVAEEAVAVGGHGDEVAVLVAGGVDDLGGRISAGEFHGNESYSASAEFGGGFIEILAVAAHFFGFGQAEAVVVSRDPAVSHMHKQEFRAEVAGKFGDVRQERFIRLPIFKSNENLAVHGQFTGAASPKEL
jgi:hypothetical protein